MAIPSSVSTTLNMVDAGINSAATIAATIPGLGPVVAAVLRVGELVVNAIGIRSGADEANAITKVQTPLGAQLIAINAAIPYANIAQLQTMYSAVGQLGLEFAQFVAGPQFTDGRASTQALNTIMPLINGTGGYTSKSSPPGCYHCGPAGGGEDGIQGSIQRQILALGGGSMNMSPPTVTQGQTSGYLPTLDSQSYESYAGSAQIQAGSLPIYPATSYANFAPAVVSTGLFEAGNLPLVVGAVLLFLFIRKRG